MAEELGSLAVSIGLDSSGFQNGVSGINKSMKVLDSEFKANTAALGANGTALEKLNLKSENLSKGMELQKQKVSSLEDAYNKSVETKGKDAKATQDLEIKLNLARAGLSNMETQLESTNNALAAEERQIQIQASSWTKLGTTLNSVGDKMKSVGDKTGEIGKKLSTAITVPLVAIGTGLVALGAQFDDAYDNIRIGTGATGKDLEGLQEDFKAVTKGVPDEFGDVSIAIADLNTRLNLSGKPLQDLSTQMLNLSRLTGTDLTSNIENVSKAFSASGVASEDYGKSLDYVFKVSQSTGIGVDQLLANIQKFAPAFKNMGLSLEASTTLMGQLSKAGVDVDGVMAGLNKGIAKMAKEGITDANKAVGMLFDEIKKAPNDMAATQAAVEIFGAKSGPQLAKAIREGKMSYTELMDTLKGSKETINGVTSETEDWAEGFKKLKNNLMIALEPLAGSFFNAISKLIPYLQSGVEWVTKMADKFNALSPAQQDNILKFGLLAAAVGPVLVVVGKMVSIGGVLATGLGTISTAMGAASVATTGVGVAGVAGASGLAGVGAALGGAVVAAAPFLVAGAAIAGVGLLVHKGMTKEAVPAVDLFADKSVTTAKTVTDANGVITTSYDTTVTKISDATEKAVGAYIKLDDEATKAVTDLYVNSTTITGQISAELTTKFNEMGAQIKTGIDKHFNESYGSIDKFFKDSTALTTAEETKILADMKIKNEEKKKETDTYTKQIQDILKKASDEKRALTLDEQVKINEIQNKMKIGAIKALSDGEVESKVILERLKAYTTRITAEQASEEIKNANKARDGSITAANEKYTKSVAEIIKMRDESKTITADQADKLIADAKRQSEETIKHAEEMRETVITKITNMNEDTVNNVDLATGKILNAWDKLKNWWNSWWPEPKNISVTQTTTYEESGARGSIPMNATGNRNFSGGLTTLHEKGYEVYDLPGGSRIYNHEASEDLVLKTAQEVAKGVSGSNKGITQNLNIYSPTALSPSETARMNRRALQELALIF